MSQGLLYYVAAAILAVFITSVYGVGTEPPATPTPTVEQLCASLNSTCGDCVSRAECLWCSSSQQKCLPYPTGQIIPHSSYCSLSDARWGVCWVNYEALLITMGVVAGVLLISCSCCIYCCCCRSKSNKNKYLQEDARLEREREERQQRNNERRADRKVKLDEIRRKYGLVKDEPTYERFDV